MAVTMDVQALCKLLLIPQMEISFTCLLEAHGTAIGYLQSWGIGKIQPYKELTNLSAQCIGDWVLVLDQWELHWSLYHIHEQILPTRKFVDLVRTGQGNIQKPSPDNSILPLTGKNTRFQQCALPCPVAEYPGLDATISQSWVPLDVCFLWPVPRLWFLCNS